RRGGRMRAGVWAGLLVLACNQGREPGTDEVVDTAVEVPFSARVLALSPDLASGEALYADHCAICHGGDGEGLVGPAHTEVLPDLPRACAVDVVHEGRGLMPSHADLSHQELADVIGWAYHAFADDGFPGGGASTCR
ncbi:MAG: c-type cytochrome, partial [Myxococcales bacterium]|nr:c-type cytochrome [Myxococcales bacterium]